MNKQKESRVSWNQWILWQVEKNALPTQNLPAFIFFAFEK